MHKRDKSIESLDLNYDRIDSLNDRIVEITEHEQQEQQQQQQRQSCNEKQSIVLSCIAFIIIDFAATSSFVVASSSSSPVCTRFFCLYMRVFVLNFISYYHIPMGCAIAYAHAHTQHKINDLTKSCRSSNRKQSKTIPKANRGERKKHTAQERNVKIHGTHE